MLCCCAPALFGVLLAALPCHPRLEGARSFSSRQARHMSLILDRPPLIEKIFNTLLDIRVPPGCGGGDKLGFYTQEGLNEPYQVAVVPEGVPSGAWFMWPCDYIAEAHAERTGPDVPIHSSRFPEPSILGLHHVATPQAITEDTMLAGFTNLSITCARMFDRECVHCFIYHACMHLVRSQAGQALRRVPDRGDDSPAAKTRRQSRGLCR